VVTGTHLTQTLQPSISINPEFSVKVTSQSYKIRQDEISDLIKELQLTNSTAEPFVQVYNSAIFWIKCKSESISFAAKRF
jgi:capsule polysaccharide modification protein KpsS